MRLAIVAPLPPAKTGPAPYLASLLPELAHHAELTLCVPDVEAVAPELRQQWDVRPLDERFGRKHDLVVYHVANNPLHVEVNAAAMEGPPGLVVVHDASLHHLQIAQTLGVGDAQGYVDLMAAGHGDIGRELGELAVLTPAGPLGFERFLFDLLSPLLSRQLGAQVHSRYALELLRRRIPGLPVHVVPMRAPAPVAPADLTQYGVPRGRVILGHAGFVTAPKRFDVMCEATAVLIAEGYDLHLVFAGEDGSRGDLDAVVAALGLQDRVTCTGWQSDDDFERTVAAFDIAMSLRWPHVGESSATLAALLSYGVAVVAEPVGSWAEFPRDVVAAADLGKGAVEGLVETLRGLVADPLVRAAWGGRARAYAREELSPERCARLFAAACAELLSVRKTPAEHLRWAEARKAAALSTASTEVSLRLAQLPVAVGRQQLVTIGAPPEAAALMTVWGYDVSAEELESVGTGTMDVVSAWGAVSLAEVNRVLVPGGLFHHSGAAVAMYGLSEVAPGLARKTGPVLALRPLLPQVVDARR